MRGIVSWFAQNHVAANLLMLFLMVAGVITIFTIKLEVFPETSLDMISISVLYPGASPAEVEEAVIRPIEEEVAGLTGIEKITSVASEGIGSISVEVMKGWDLQKLLDEVKSTVDRVRGLPEEAEDPVVSELTRRTQVITAAVHGNVSEELLKQTAERIEDDLAARPEITTTGLAAVRPLEVHIEISEEQLRRYGLTLGGVASIVSRSSLDLPAGSVKTVAGEILVRAKGRLYRAAEYEEIAVVTRPDGAQVTLGEIAEVADGFPDSDLYAGFQGRPAVFVYVYRVGDQNALEVAGAVKEYMAEVREKLPQGVQIDLIRDRSDMLRSRMNLLLRNMSLGLLLVCGVLGLFLNLRLAFWVALGIPISFLAAIWALPWFGVSINMMSLFSFILVLGIVVDDAIVVGEHIYTKREAGMAPMAASIDGTVRIGRPVIFSVLTTVAAFLPLLAAGGMIGKIMANIPVVVILVLMGSLVESLLILPAHLVHSRICPSGGGPAREKWAVRGMRRVIDGPYRRLLDRALRWRYVTVATGVALLLLSAGFIAGGHIRFTFFPRVEGDWLTADVTMPADSPVERTIMVLERLETAAQEALAEADTERPEGSEPLLQSTYFTAGMTSSGGPHGSSSSAGHIGQIRVQLLDAEKRDVNSRELVARWRKKMGPVSEAEEISFSGEIFRAGNPLEVHLSAASDDELLRAVEDLKGRLADYSGVFAIGDSFQPGKMELQLDLKDAARPLGLTLMDLASQVRHALYGAEALRLQRDGEEVKVLVRYPLLERRSLADIQGMRIRTPDGRQVPFGEVADVRLEQGYSSIERTDQRRVVRVFADVNPSEGNAAEIRTDLEAQLLPAMTGEYDTLRMTIEGEGREQRETMADLTKGFAFALLLIYTLLAVPFRSFSQPFIVMFAIPFGLVGALVGHLIMGLDLSILSMFGMIGLTGVVVNDSLVLIDAANRLREEGRTAMEAIRLAGPMRFRAIILTSLTTFAGLAPMILEQSLQAKFLIPMAVALGFGVLGATGITLLLIPSLYLILEDWLGLMKRWTPWKPMEEATCPE